MEPVSSSLMALPLLDDGVKIQVMFEVRETHPNDILGLDMYMYMYIHCTCFSQDLNKCLSCHIQRTCSAATIMLEV